MAIAAAVWPLARTMPDTVSNADLLAINAMPRGTHCLHGQHFLCLSAPCSLGLETRVMAAKRPTCPEAVRIAFGVVITDLRLW